MSRRTHPRPRRRPRLLAGLALSAAVVAASCGGEGTASSDDPTVVVTTPVLGALVRDIVGDAATVRVLMPNGVDPHDWEPSAQDMAEVSRAALVVANGLDLEHTLDDALESAESDGTPVFSAGDHVTVRPLDDGDGEHEEEVAEDGDDHGHASGDPHLWLDPLTMRDMVDALGPALVAAGIDVGDRAARVSDELESLDADVSAALAGIPDDDRLLVTGHESLGYFADRYDLELVGAVVPSTSSQAEASAGDIADLVETMEETGASTVFTELGTPEAVVRAVAEATGAQVVQLPTHTLPDDGTYRTFVLDIATSIASALSGTT